MLESSQNKHARARARAHTDTQTHTDTSTHRDTQTHARTHTHTQTHTDTRTDTDACSYPVIIWVAIRRGSGVRLSEDPLRAAVAS